MNPAVNILSISYGRDLLNTNSRAHKRIKFYAEEVHSYDIIVFTKKSEGFSIVKNENLTIHPTNSSNKVMMFINAVSIGRKILKNDDIKSWVVTSQDPFKTSTIGFILKFITGVKHHVQLHGDFYGKVGKKNFFNSIKLWFGLFIIKRACGVRVVSSRIKDSLIKLGIFSSKITSVAVQSNLDSFLTATPDMLFREQFSKDAVVIITAARLEKEKNLKMLIDAFRYAHKSDPRLRLCIIGEGSQKQLLKKYVSSKSLEDIVTFMPWTESLPGLMVASDIYALSSDHEGWGMVLVESMATGTPVVTTDVGCVGEVCLDDEHGIVVPVGDTKAFANALVSLAKDKELRKKMGRQAQIAVKNHSMTQEEYRQKMLTAITQYCKGWVY